MSERQAKRIRARIRALRCAGELLKQIEPAKGGDRGNQYSQRDGTVPLASRKSAAADAGLSERQAKRIRARALRRAGELLKQIEPNKGGRPSETGVGAHTSFSRGANQNISKGDRTKVLTREGAAREAGMSKHQQVQATRLANVPEDAFEEMVENGATVTQIADAGHCALEAEP